MYVCVYVCMYVCMYVCPYVLNGFTITTYGFMHSLCTFLACAAHDAIVEDRREYQNESRNVEGG